jgi:hypothetical protein
MYFKRPSFKRGGSTGIAQLTPRVHAKMGFPNFGVGQGDNTGYQKYLADMRANQTSEQPSGIASMVLGPRYTDPNFVSPFLKKDSPFFSNRTGFEFMNLGTGNNEPRTYMTSEGPKVVEDIEDIKITSDSDDLTNNANRDMQEIIRKAEKDFKNKNTTTTTGTTTGTGTGTNKEDILTSELSMKDAITDEVDILKELLKGTGMSKGEKALLAAKAIRTPGTIADKLEVAGDLALKEIQEQKKQEKAIILTAYKNYKAKDLAGDKMNREETLVKNLVNRQLKDPKNTKSKSQLELEAWKSLAPGDNKDVNKEFALLKLADRGFQVQIQDAQSDIKNYGKKNDAASKAKVAEAQRILDLAAQYATAAGLEIPVYAEGGRVERAVGSPMVGETPNATMEATEVVAADNIEPMAPVTKMDFADLRNRLPQEITDDIVQLLANSEEALQAFAYIKTQEDINAFNIKYGVNLILPAENV